nr:Dihydrofolate reductase [uncultured bacterium]
MQELVGIAAVARNGVIGSDGDIPWRIREDWQRFKAVTMGSVLIMGRKTYDSIGRPLPGRTTIVVTRDRRWRGDGVRVAPTVDEAFELASSLAPTGTVFVAGGGEIYRESWPRLDRLEITEVDAEPKGNVTLPAISVDDWEETVRDPHEGFAFVSYRRRLR